MRLALRHTDVGEKRLKSHARGMRRSLQFDDQKGRGRCDILPRALGSGSIRHGPYDTTRWNSSSPFRGAPEIDNAASKLLRFRKVRNRSKEGDTVTEDMASEVWSLGLPDDEFISTFERGGFAADAFPHRAHLRMAWLYVTHLGPEAAIDRAAGGIRNLAQANGQSTLYHDTLTRAWVYLVAAAVVKSPSVTFAEFLARNPQLLDKQLVLQHYSPDLLSSSQARATWVAPDVAPIPGAPPSTDAGGEADSTQPVDAAAYVAALRSVPTAVAVVSASDGVNVHGMTASSVTSLSLDPPLVLVCVKRDSRILPMIRASKYFGVSFLNDHQRHVAPHFALPQRPSGAAQFHGIPHRAGRFGVPILSEASAWLECGLWCEYPGGDHTIICGLVTGAAAGDGHPLLSYAGGFR